MPDAHSGATVASSWRRIPRVLPMAVLALTVAIAGSLALEPQPVAAANGAKAINKTAQSLIGTRYRYGATGMSRFDCSGFVFRVYQMNGLLDRIGGKRRTAAGYFNYFRNRGLTTKKPAVGDLVVWGKRASHIGIYAGTDNKGRPMAISALVTGVARHPVAGINVPLKAYLRVNLGGSNSEPPPEEAVSSQAASKPSKAKAPQAKNSTNTSTYKIKRGDTLSRIARAKGVTVKKILRVNPQITNRNVIYAGHRILIP